jgi:hypothetical protein
VDRWKRIEQVREESGFYLHHLKNRKENPTFRAMVNFDKALNDPMHPLHRRIEERNEHRIGKSSPIVKAKSRIEVENQELVKNAFKYMLELGHNLQILGITLTSAIFHLVMLLQIYLIHPDQKATQPSVVILSLALSSAVTMDRIYVIHPDQKAIQPSSVILCSIVLSILPTI